MANVSTALSDNIVCAVQIYSQGAFSFLWLGGRKYSLQHADRCRARPEVGIVSPLEGRQVTFPFTPHDAMQDFYASLRQASLVSIIEYNEKRVRVCTC